MYLVSLARKVIKTSGFIYQVYILAIAIYVGLLYAVDSVESSCIRAVMHSVT